MSAATMASAEQEWRAAVVARSDHDRACRDGCPLTPCPAGQQIAADEWTCFLAARAAWDAQRGQSRGDVRPVALALAFLAGLLGLGGYWLVDDAARHYGPLLAAWWGG